MSEDICNKRRFTVGDKIITVYPCGNSDRPVIYLNTFSDDGERVYRMLEDSVRADFTLVSVGGLNWNHDMSPWEIPPVSKGDTPCTGGADGYLNVLLGDIIPQAEKKLRGVSWRGLAGYSLGGLFAIYALYKTDVFSRAGSMSGSLWFPDFREFVFSHEMMRTPERLYFSLGDTEYKTSNPYLKTVQKNTEEIEAFYRKKGIDTVFCLNPGNHFKNAAARTAMGIVRLLNK